MPETPRRVHRVTPSGASNKTINPGPWL
jgi:hypothetical protein